MSNILHRHGRWHRLRWQLVGGFLSALIPYLARISSLGPGNELQLLHHTFAGCVIAIIASIFLLRSITSYPGIEGSAYIIPSLSMNFGILILLFMLGRIEYSRYIILSSFMLSLLWLYFVYFIKQRQRLTIGLIPSGRTEKLTALDTVKWVRLEGPEASIADINAITADFSADISEGWEKRLAEIALEGVPVYPIKHLIESLTGRIELEHLAENSFGSLSPVSAYMTVKHAGDKIIALFAGLALFPVALIVAALIKFDSPGPVIFQQKRVGYQGKIFTVYKFRTMTNPTPEDLVDPKKAVTGSDDRRITRLGAFLRKYRIDEIPQIVNILKGEMSWIGPRPEPELLSRWFEEQIAFYRYRHIVRPGITGWAQVCQGYAAGIEEIRTKLSYDFYYIKNYSPWIDTLIIARTVRTMLTGSGAR